MRLKSVLSTVILFLVLAFTLSFAEQTPFNGKINSNNINLRSDATASAYIIAVLNKDQQVEVVAESYEWYKVRLPKIVPAYIKSTLVNCINYSQVQTPGATSESCVSVKVLRDRVNIRAKPNENSPILGLADQNEVIGVLARDGLWYKIEPIDNSFGWVHKKFVDKVTINQANVEVNKESKTKVSLPSPQEDKNIILIGTVKPYGVIFGRRATHKLITQDNKTYLLKGNRASLNSLNQQKVKIIGKRADLEKSGMPIIEVKIVEVISAE